MDTGGKLRGEQEKETWTATEHYRLPATAEGGPPSVSGGAGQSPGGRDALKKAQDRVRTSRLARSVLATPQPALPLDTEVNSTAGNSTVSLRGPQLELHKPKQDDGDLQPTTETPGDGSSDDYSGEVEEVDPPAASLPVGSDTSWGSRVPHVPATWMTALYFSGRREQLRLKPAAGFELPRSKLSVELWVKPEGGQSNPAVIAGG